MRRLGTDRPEDRPVTIVVDHLHGFVGRRAPDGGGCGPLAVLRAALPVVVIVVDHQPERFAAVTATRIGLVDGQLCSVEHAQSENLVSLLLDRPEESDPHFADVCGIRDIAPCAGVDVRRGVVAEVWLGKLLVGLQILRRPRIRRDGTVRRRTRRMRSARAARPRRFRARSLRGLRYPNRRRQYERSSEREPARPAPSALHGGYSSFFGVRNIAMASISTSSSGRHSLA